MNAPAAAGVAAAAQRPVVARRAVHGVLLVDKPLGWSSNDVLQKARRLLRAEKAGHTGTLDPLASGLLPVCLGAATKFSQVSLEADKAYRATVSLGRTTTTGDGEGELVSVAPVHLTRAQVEAACVRFTGTIDQTPPMHSALKHEGKALYEYARAGIEVAREPRRVTIHRLDIVHWQDDTLVLDVSCSKGTYIRTLAQDLGTLLGCGAHLAALRRTGSGALKVQDAVTLEQLAALDEPQRDACLLPVDHLLGGWPSVRLAELEAGRLLAGMRLRVAQPDAAAVRVYGPEPGAFLGSAHIRGGELIATRLLSPLEVNAMVPS